MIFDDAVDELVVLGAKTSHGILEEPSLQHVLVGAMLQLIQERILHVSCELLLDNIVEASGVLSLVLVRNGADLVVVAQAENAAHGHGIVANLALGGAVDGIHVPVNVGLDDRRRVLGARRGQHDLEVAFCLER